MRPRYQILTALTTLIFGVILSVAGGLLAWFGTESLLLTLIGVTVPLLFVASAIYQIMGVGTRY